jgi:hypothetical protein
MPSAAVRAVFEWGRQRGRPVAVLFADVRAAFYSVLTEGVLGRLLSLPARRIALQHVGFSEAAVAVFAREFVDGPSLVTQQGVSPLWSRLLVGWHRQVWFLATGGSRRIYTRVGARPGDPLADLVLALGYGALQLEFAQALHGQGFLFAVEAPMGRLFAAPGPSEVVDVPPANYVDEADIFLEASFSLELFSKLRRGCVGPCVLSVAWWSTSRPAKRKPSSVLPGPAWRPASSASSRLKQLSVADCAVGDEWVPLLPLEGGASMRFVAALRRCSGAVMRRLLLAPGLPLRRSDVVAWAKRPSLWPLAPRPPGHARALVACAWPVPGASCMSLSLDGWQRHIIVLCGSWRGSTALRRRARRCPMPLCASAWRCRQWSGWC